jgi:hypothetical protein
MVAPSVLSLEGILTGAKKTVKPLTARALRKPGKETARIIKE